MTRCVFAFLLFTILIWNAQCAKILLVYHMPSYSHFALGFRLAEALIERGHQITAITAYPLKRAMKNYTDISVADNADFMEEIKRNLFGLNTNGPLENIKFLAKFGIGLTDRTFAHKNVQKLLNSGESFDVVIMEHFLNEAHVGIGHHFKAPVILMATSASSNLNNYIFANPAPSSYVPNVLAALPRHMNFFQRVKNCLFNLLGNVMRELIFMPGQRQIFKKYVKTDLELDDVLYNVSLMLSNSHVSVNDAAPHVPSMIEIGGFHVYPPKKLPDDLQKFLDESKEGVVLFSMGSNLKSKDLQPELRTALLKAFSKIKQTVLWKFEEDLPDIPKNVKIMKWLPQQDILAHPNVKAFISHGGLLSTIEAVYHGVPIIGIPVFGDQKNNIINAANSGYAVAIPFPELSEEKLSWALNEILNNPKYGENVKQRSRVMNDQPLKPIDTATYWVEHVIRHKGAPHLQSAGIDLKWYEREMVDIILFLIFVTTLVIVTFYIIIKKMLKLCFKKEVKVTKSKKNE